MSDEIFKEVKEARHFGYEIAPLIANRWSPRAFKEQEIPEDVLDSLFEAARWAPSSSNGQPWRFIVAKTREEKAKFYPFIAESNRSWCERASALAVICSKKTFANGNPSGSHSFDAGTAWGYLALEAVNKGLITHAMGGFNKDEARITLQVPDDYDLHAVIAIGYRADKSILNDKQQEREFPSGRLSLDEIIYKGSM